MQTIDIVKWPVDVDVLSSALRTALPDKIIGLSTYGEGRPISIFTADDIQAGDIQAILSTVDAHKAIEQVPGETTISINLSLESRLAALEKRIAALEK